MSAPIGPTTPWRPAGTDPDFPVTISIASPAVITWGAGAHGLVQGNTVAFETNGLLPTGIVAFDTPIAGGGVVIAKPIYYVRATGLGATTFQISATAPVKGVDGAAVNTSGSQSGSHYARPAYGAAQLGDAILVGGAPESARQGAA